MPKMTKIELPDMYISFEKGIRGGISYISNRYSKPNNKYLKCYEPKQESKHITDLDVNNLHGYTMSKFLPTKGFKWTDLKEFNLNKYTSNSSKGCNLKVDLEYPRELRDLHNYFPLTPDKEKCVIYYENLQLYLRLGLKLKNKIHYVLRIQSVVKTIY